MNISKSVSCKEVGDVFSPFGNHNVILDIALPDVKGINFFQQFKNGSNSSCDNLDQLSNRRISRELYGVEFILLF